VLASFSLGSETISNDNPAILMTLQFQDNQSEPISNYSFFRPGTD
jgi:hypothetical protein